MRLEKNLISLGGKKSISLFSLVLICIFLFCNTAHHVNSHVVVPQQEQHHQQCTQPHSIPNAIVCGCSDSLNSSIYDTFAGYKIIASVSVCVKKLTHEHAVLGSNIVVDDIFKCDFTTSVYQSNGSTLVSSRMDSIGECLVNEMSHQMDELLALPCDHFIPYVSTQKKFMFKSGGVYCFETRYSILTDPVFIVSGNERVVLRMFTNGIINPKFVHLKCSSYRNVFMILDGSSFCFITGDVDCTIINHKNLLSLGSSAPLTLKGSVWARGSGHLTFSDVIIGNSTSFSPFSAIDIDNYTLCSDIQSTAQSVCSGNGKCDDYNVCNCHTHYYGMNCEITTCNSIPSNSSSVCSGKGNCTSYNQCTCLDGYVGSNCEYFGCTVANSIDHFGNVISSCEIPQERIVQDEFAGYKLITTGSILLQNVASSNLKLSSSIVIGSMSPQNYIANGSAVVTYSSTTLGSKLVQDAQTKVNSMRSLPCTILHQSQNTNYLYIKNGGVYCFDQGWSASGTVIIEGTVPVVFKLYTNLNYGTMKFIYLKCASFRNVFWLVSGSCSISGTFEGTLVPSSSVNMNNVVINGAVWNVGGGSMNFNNVIFTAPSTFDIYEPIVGDFCNETLCYNVKSGEDRVCSGHGSCIGYNQCSCQPGFYLSNCSITECNGVFSTVSTVCSGHGSCVAKDTCQCNENYYGSLCQYTTCYGIDNYSPNVCSQHGVCNTFNNCICNSTLGFGGPNCEYPICDGYWSNNENVCNGRGSCQTPNVCKCCSDKYYGQFCELTTCGGIESTNLEVCSKRGRCSSFNTCVCNAGYYGTICSNFNCYGVSNTDSNVCSGGHGFCKDIDSCECESDYSGEYCQNTSCHGVSNSHPNVCSSHGNCSSHNQCTCNSSYSGTNCEFTTCNSINSTDPIVCSSHGSCRDFNNCSCQVGYHGIWCHEWTCFGMSNSDPTVCSGNGKCIDKETCQCSLESYGADCSHIKCNGMDVMDPNVCGGHGHCVGPGTCNCSGHFHGKWCELTNCENIESNNSLVCNGHGQCLDYNVCKCVGGYYGSNCDEFDCFGIARINSSTCSGNGKCTDLDVCSCQVGFEGSACERDLSLVSNNGSENVNSTEYNNSTISQNGTILSNETIPNNETYSNETLLTNTTVLNETVSVNETTTNNTIFMNETLTTNTTDSFSNETTLNETISTNTTFSNGTIHQNETTNVYNETLQENSTTESSNSTFSNETSSLNQTESSTKNISDLSNSTEVENSTSLENSTQSTNHSTLNETIPIDNHNMTETNQTNEIPNPTIYCNPSLNCSNHGLCSSNGTCICHSDFSNGFYSGLTCSSCSNGFYGKLCATKFEGPASFSSDFRGVVFKLYLPGHFSNIDIPCRLLISEMDIYQNLFGDFSAVKCQYINKKLGLFMIRFGSIDYALYPGLTVININIFIFESMEGNQNTSFISLPVVLPHSVESPKAIVSVVKLPNLDSFSTCEEISIDGSYSHSVDGKPLIYHWSLLDASTLEVVSSDFPNKPIIRLDSSLNQGDYVMSLVVESTFLGMNSSRVLSRNFTKSANPLPLLYIPYEIIEKTTNQFPLTVRKVLRESNCQSETSRIEWSQIHGPSVEFHVDQYNNLVISKLSVFGSYSYIFKVSAYYPTNPNETVSSQVTLKTMSPQLNLKITQTESNENRTSIQIDYSDPESLFNNHLKKEMWTWTCELCTPDLKTFLTSLSLNRTTLFTIEYSLFKSQFSHHVDLMLKIEKSDGRSTECSTRVYFRNAPPSLTILYAEPSSPYVKQGQTVLIHVFVSTLSDSGAVLKWNFNESDTLGNMNVFGESTVVISIETGNLEEGSTNTVLINIRDLSNNSSSSISYTFSISWMPKPCYCAVEPFEGYALETEFDFFCSNCRNSDDNIDYKYGFIDDRSGSRIYLYSSGELFASKLPAPFSGSIVNCFFDIYNYETGASTTKFVNVTVFKPTITDISQIQKLVRQWEDLSNLYFMEGDFSRSIYQAATTSRTDAVLLRETIAYMMKNSKREMSNSLIKCDHGVDISGSCKCMDGYVGPKCDISIKDFSNIQATKLQMLDNIITIINSTEGTINDNYLSLFAFAIDSLLFNYEYLDSNTITESLYTLNMFLRYALIDLDTKLSSGVDTLLNSCIDSAYNYVVDKQYLTDQISNSRALLKALKQASNLQARRISVGKLRRQNSGPFYTVIMGRNILYDFPSLVMDPNSRSVVTFESGFFKIDTKSSSLLTQPFVYSISVTSDIYSLDKTLQISQQVSDTSNKLSYLISPIVSVAFNDVPVPLLENAILYTLPLNLSSAGVKPTFLDMFDFTQQDITYSCGNFRDDSIELSLDCSIVSQNESFIQCRCTQLTNVFVMQTITTSYFSVLYIIALSLVLVFVCCLCCVSCVGAFSFCRSKVKQTTIVHPYVEEITVQSVGSSSTNTAPEDVIHHGGEENMDHSTLEKETLIIKKPSRLLIPMQPVFSWRKTVPVNLHGEHTAVDLYDEENSTSTQNEVLEDVESDSGEEEKKSSNSSSTYLRKESINPTALNIEQVKSSLENNEVGSTSITP